MPIGICPTVDFVFKQLFGNPKHSRIAIHFLNAILQHLLKVNKIVFRNPIQEQETEDDKLSILDILATDEHGRTFIIEMQTSVPAGMGQRLTYYTACEYVDQLGKGQDYVSLRPVISICVLTDPMFRKVPELHLHFALRSETGVMLTEDLQVHVLQLSNLRVTEENLRYASPLEQWSYFLLRAETLTMDEIKRLLPDEIFSEAASVLDVVAKTPEQKQRYEARLKFLRDEAARTRSAREEGFEEGIEQGIQQGIDQGIEQGIEQGIVKGIVKGIERGELFGRIKTLQGLVGAVESTREELSDYSDEQLTTLLEQLRDQLRSRKI